MVVTIPKIDAYHIGYMIYFFEKSLWYKWSLGRCESIQSGGC